MSSKLEKPPPPVSNVSKGFTLIETTIFLVVMSLITITLVNTLSITTKTLPNIENQQTAINLAEERIAFIVGQKAIQGFANFNDLCTSTPALPICNQPSGYTVTSNIANNWQGNSNFKLITVTVSGHGNATLSTLVANDD